MVQTAFFFHLYNARTRKSALQRCPAEKARNKSLRKGVTSKREKIFSFFRRERLRGALRKEPKLLGPKRRLPKTLPFIHGGESKVE